MASPPPPSPIALQAFSSLLQALVSLSLPAPAQPLLASRPALRASMAAAALSALRSPRAAPTDPLRTQRLLHRLMGAAGVAKAAAAATRLGAGIEDERRSVATGFIGEAGVAKVGVAVPAVSGSAGLKGWNTSDEGVLHAGSDGGGTGTAEAGSWWDATYCAVRPLMGGMGARQLSGLLYLLASMVDAGSSGGGNGGTSTATTANGGPANRDLFELPPSEWVEEALNHVIGEGRLFSLADGKFLERNLPFVSPPSPKDANPPPLPPDPPVLPLLPLSHAQPTSAAWRPATWRNCCAHWCGYDWTPPPRGCSA